jgi:ABC-type amino acid transport substrate-binding protein
MAKLKLGSKLFLSVLTVFTAVSAEDNPLVITAAQGLETHAAGIAILERAYEQIGVAVEFSIVPAARALKESNAGVSDGDVARIANIQLTYENLRPVPTPIIHIRAYAFSRDTSVLIKSWDDLSTFKIGVLRGIRYSEIGTEGMNRTFYDSYNSMFNMLDKGRLDYAIGVHEQALQMINQNFPGSGIKEASSVLFEAPLYHYVHERNAHLIPKLDAVFQKMRDNGELDLIYLSQFQ